MFTQCVSNEYQIYLLLKSAGSLCFERFQNKFYRNQKHNTKKKKKMGLCLLYINMLMLGSFSQYFLMLYMKVTCTLIALYKS